MRTEPSFSAHENSLDDHDLDDLQEFEHEEDFSHSEPIAAGGLSDAGVMADYRERYGLSADPFADDPHFPFYTGAQRRAVLDQVLHLCQFSQNLLVVTGDYGVGKTRMAQALIDCLDDADDICFLEAQITSDGDSLLRATAEQFELSSEQLPDFYRQTQEGQGLVVVIVDNAHHLDDQAIADFVLQLTSAEAERLHIVFFAEPHILPRLEKMDIDGVVLSDFHLEPFLLHEAVDYLNFRMEMADYLGPEIFTETIVDPWWRESQGQIHFLHEQAQARLLNSVVAPNQKREYRLPKPTIPLPHVIASSVLLTVLIVGYFYWGASSDKKVATDVSSAVGTEVTTPVANSAVVKSEEKTPSQTTTTQGAAVQGAVAQSTAATEFKESGANPTVSTSVPVQPATPVGAVENKPATQVAAQAASADSVQPSALNPPVKERVVPLVEASAQMGQSTGVQKPTSAAVKSTLTTQKEVVAVSKDVPASIKETTAAKPTAIKPAIEPVEKTSNKSGLSDQERTLMSWPDNEYTLQLLGVSSAKAADEFIASQSNKKDLMLFRSKRAGKDWYVIVTGRFSTSAKARQALPNLPEAQRKAAPWPRDMKAIHSDISNR